MALEAVAEAHWVQNISQGAFLFSWGKKVKIISVFEEILFEETFHEFTGALVFVLTKVTHSYLV